MGDQLAYTLVAVSLVNVLLFAGIIFGWAPMLLWLKSEGQYDELCLDGASSCEAQELQFALIFSAGTFLVNGISLPSGIFLDYCGPRVMIGVAALLEIPGLILFGLADSKTFDVFLPAFCCIAVGGQMTLFSAFPTAFAIEGRQAGVFASISCLFDASSIMFQLLYLTSQHMAQGPASTTRRDIFLFFAGVAAVMYFAAIMTWTRYLAQQNDDEGEAASVEELEAPPAGPLPTVASGVQLESDAYGSLNAPPKSAAAAVPLTERPLLQQLRTFQFVFVLVFATCGVFRANLYIGVNSILLQDLGDGLHGNFYTTLFGYFLPAGFLFIPVIERSIERFGLVGSMHFTNGLAVAVYALAMVASLQVQAGNFLVFAAYRAYLYAVMAAYIGQVFGLLTLGRITGCVFTASSIVNILQEPALKWCNQYFHGDLRILTGGMLLVGLLLTGFVEYFRRAFGHTVGGGGGGGGAAEPLLGEKGRSAASPSPYLSQVSASPAIARRHSIRRGDSIRRNRSGSQGSDGGPGGGRTERATSR
jgi:hypothetical protein